ncbi:hypothetical protein GA0061078_1305 [Bifidobacterium bohemicum]|uniref:ATP-binding domain-containing protein 3 n=1 Tax=Bifidobacterium bohemicum DSM 22767 TaxID=1437606 RepID=A0A086ZHQ1_9BIFI|nr:DUF6541 family protein [Bifidobacterium bohemicum]KFI46051.1 ATP-binding domain-containing protein 3 [Bifidobacterium bohemicum DSM 22767]SCC05685.1 hypothetical protein GA0061078_1305 [Bifidobacterium bohemicum]
MWFAFGIAAIVALVLMYLPGLFLFRCFRLSWLSSLCFAPALAVGYYGIVSIFYSVLHIRSSWITLFLPLMVVAVLLYVCAKVTWNSQGRSDADSKRFWGLAVLYIMVGVVVTGFLFVKNLDGADSVSQLYDNAWHLSIIRKFINTGDYSTLHAGDIIATLGSKFYPTGWHIIVALTASIVGANIGVCENAAIFVICAVVFPLSMFSLFRKLFAERYAIILVGSVTPMLFAIYPWRFITFGPLYSNLLSFAILPLAMVLLVYVIQASTQTKDRIKYLVLFLISIISVAVAQPNAVFTLGILVAPYLYTQVPHYVDRNTHWNKSRKNIQNILVWFGLTLGIAIVWWVLYHAKFMRRTVTWVWPAIERPKQAVIDIAFLGFHNAEPQIMLGIIVLIGIVYTLIHLDLLWITCAYAIMCGLYALSAATDGRLKAFLTGFWYHDAYRLGASTVFFGSVLAGLGIYTILLGARQIVGLSRIHVSAVHRRVLAVIMVMIICLVDLFPSYYLFGQRDVTTAFGGIRRDIAFWNSVNEPKSYTSDERRFVQKVKQVVPEDSVIINQPYDGSAYAYGLDDLNVYYKAWNGNWMGTPTSENYQISSAMNHIASDENTCSAVKKVESQYLIKLDSRDYREDSDNHAKMRSMYAAYTKKDWRGIDAVNDKTPGLKVVLKQGDMRLYRITANCT